MGKLDLLRKELEKAKEELHNKGYHFDGHANSYQELMNAKPFEIAYQDVIEKIWPDDAWWQVTNYWDIFDAMMSGISDEEIIDEIIKHVGEDYVNESKCDDVCGSCVERGHTMKEYLEKFGEDYENGKLWDFDKKDFEEGLVENRNDIVYWYMKDLNEDWRYFETNVKHELKEEKKLDEGTSNFGSLDNFPLLVFYTIDEFYWNMHHHPDYPQEEQFENEDDEIDWDAFEDAKDAFEQKYWDENKVCVLDEDEQERLKNKLYDFNEESKRMAWDADVVDDEQQYGDNLNLEDVRLEIEPGYYEAAYINVENERYLDYLEDDFKAQQMERFNKFFDEIKKEFGLTKLSLAFRASNGETGYNIVKDESLKESDEVSREEYCVIVDGNNESCHDTEEEAIKYARKRFAEKGNDSVVKVLLVKYGPKDEHGDEPEEGVETIWASHFEESLEEDKDEFQIQFVDEDDEIVDGGTFDNLEDAKEEAIDGYHSEYVGFVIYNAKGDIVFSEDDLEESLEESKKKSPEDFEKEYVGKRAIFTHLDEYDEEEQPGLKDREGEPCDIKSAEILDAYDDGGFDRCYWNIEFDDGEKFIGIPGVALSISEDESLEEKKSKKKYKVNFTGDPAKNAAFFNHAMGSDKGEASVEMSSTTLGEEKILDLDDLEDSLLKEEMDFDTIKSLANEFADRLSEQDAYYNIWFDEKDNTITVGVDWGDWKHDHMWLDIFADKFFREKGYDLDNMSVEVTDEDGSDTYSANHTYVLGAKRPVEEGANYSKYAYYEYPKDSGCHVRETPTCFVATDRHGTFIGESKTKSGAEGLIDEYLNKIKVHEDLDDGEAYYYVKYWEDEELRDQGISEIYMDDFKTKEEAIRLAKKLIDFMGYASVEVFYTPSGDVNESDDELVFGYDGVEVWGPDKKEESLKEEAQYCVHLKVKDENGKIVKEEDLTPCGTKKEMEETKKHLEEVSPEDSHHNRNFYSLKRL